MHRGQKLVRLNVSFGGGLAVIEGARLFIEHEPGFEKVAGPLDVPVDRLAGAFAFGEHQAAPGVLAGGGEGLRVRERRPFLPEGEVSYLRVCPWLNTSYGYIFVARPLGRCCL